MDRRTIENGSIVEVALEPKSLADLARIRIALEALAADDPLFRYSVDAESGQTILGGQSEDHIEGVIEEINRTLGVQLTVGAPQVSYRERLTRAVELSHTHKKLAGAAGEFAKVSILFEPTGPQSGFVFEISAPDEALLAAHVSGVREGLEAARLNGVLAGFPMIDFKATLTGGAYHERDSTSRTFEIAARQAFQVLREKRVVQLVEPMFRAKVTTPDEFLGGVIGDLNARRGQITMVENHGEVSSIEAIVPVSTMFGYLNSLQTLTRGNGAVSLRFDHYEPVPRSTNDDDPNFPPAAAMRMRA